MKKVVVCMTIAVFLLTGCGTNYMKQGNQFLEEQNYAEAAASFEKATEQTENAADATRGLAICLYEQKDYQNAKDTFQKVLDIGGEATPELYNLMGVCAMHVGDYTGAAGLFQSGLALAGAKEHEVLIQEMKFNEIVCYEKQQDWETAKAKMQDYAGLYPDDMEARKEADFLSTR